MNKKLRILFLIILIISQQAISQPMCHSFFGDSSKSTYSLPTKQEIQKQVSEILVQLSNSTHFSADQIERLTVDGTKVKIYDESKLDQSHLSLQGALLLTKKNEKNGKLLSIFKGDIYFSHYYYLQYGAHFIRGKKMSLSQFSKSQPWIKWNQQSRKFTLENSNIVENILLKISDNNDTIKLYRGTNSSEIEYMQKISNFSDEVAIGEASKKIKNGAFHGFFFTDNKSAAAKWSKDGTVVSIEISKQALLKLGYEGRLYAGVEENYFEFMFFDPSTIKSIAQRYKVENILN